MMVQSNNERCICVCLNNMANVYMHKDPDKARELYYSAIANAKNLIIKSESDEQKTNKIVLAKQFMNFGIFYKEIMKDNNKAKEMYNESIRLHREAYNEFGMARVYSNLGQLDIANNNLVSARENIIDGWKLVEKSASDEAIQYGAMNMGILAKKEGNSESAITWFVHILTSYKNIISNVRNICINELLDLYQQTRRYEIREKIEEISKNLNLTTPSKLRDIFFVLNRSGSMSGRPLFKS